MDSNTYPNNIHEEYAVLINRAKSGDESAFSEIYEKAERYVYATCYGILHNKEDAEDAMQETFLAFYNNIGTIQDGQAFVSWIHTTAYFKAVNIRDKKKDTLAYEDAIAANEISEEADDNLESLPESLIIDKTNRSIIKKILRDELNADQYDTVLLYYYNEMPVSTIAQVMDCPEGTVKKRLFASRAKIKAGIESYEKFHGDKLVGAAGVPFLTKFFTECANDLTLPAIKPFPVKVPVKPAVTSSAQKGAKAGELAKDAAKSGQLAKNAGSTAGTGAKAGLFSSPWAKVGIVVAILAVLAVPLVFAIRNIKDTVKPEPTRSKVEREDEEETEVASSVSIETTEEDDTDLIPFDEVPEFEQLSRFVYCWDGEPYDCELLPEDFSGMNLLVTEQNTGLLDLSLYCSKVEAHDNVTDAYDLYESEYLYSVNEKGLSWIETNILNLSDESRMLMHAKDIVPPEFNGPDSGHYRDLSTIYYAHPDPDLNSIEYTKVTKVRFDGEYYYITAEFCNTADGEADEGIDNGRCCYYKMQLKTIDEKEYWTLLVCTDSPDFSRTWESPVAKSYTVKATEYYFDGENESVMKCDKTRREFDKNGNLLREVFYDQNDVWKSCKEYEYDATNKLILCRNYICSESSASYNTRTDYSYDESNNLIEEKTLLINSPDTFDLVSYEYDESNRLIYKEYKDNYHTKPSEWYEYKYDESDRLIEERKYADLCGFMEKRLYEYDESDNVTKKYHCEEYTNDVVVELEEYEYDSSNRLISYKDTSGSAFFGMTHTIEYRYEYDENDNLVMKTKTDTANEYVTRTEYEYNYD